MKQFKENLIARLEERKGTYFDGVTCEGTMIRINDAISIVNELAEEMDVAKNAITTWIPCRERLPEEKGDYLVTCNDGKVRVWWFVVEEDFKCWRIGVHKLKPIAWQPLPQPYVPKGDNDDRS